MHKTSAALILAMHLKNEYRLWIVELCDNQKIGLCAETYYGVDLLSTEACYESGFRDYAHFIKSFTKTFGCSHKTV